MQFLVNSIVAGSGIALVAIGFSLIYGTTRFFHFAHAAVYVVGGYGAYVFLVVGQWPWFVAMPLAIVIAALTGCLMNLWLYRPLRQRCASPLVLLLASIGLFVALQNMISLFFGDATVVLRLGGVKPGIDLFGARITPVQLALVATSILVAVCASAFLRLTRVGKVIRAVADDPALATCVGIPVERSVLFVFGLGSALAAVAAILLAYDTDLNPMQGFRALLLGVVAAIVGGIGSVGGAFLGGLLVGAAMHFGVLKLPTQWQDAIVFVILVLFLLTRPQGFFGKPLSKATV